RDPSLLRRQRADVPRDLEAVLLKCLEKDRARRYSGAAGLHADLLAIQAGGSVSARPPRFFDPAARWSRRHPAQSALLVASFGVLGFFGAQWKSNRVELAAKKGELAEKKHDLETTVEQREHATGGKRGAIAQSELMSAWSEFDSARNVPDIDANRIRFHAFERLTFLM